MGFLHEFKLQQLATGIKFSFIAQSHRTRGQYVVYRIITINMISRLFHGYVRPITGKRTISQYRYYRLGPILRIGYVEGRRYSSVGKEPGPEKQIKDDKSHIQSGSNSVDGAGDGLTKSKKLTLNLNFGFPFIDSGDKNKKNKSDGVKALPASTPSSPLSLNSPSDILSSLVLSHHSSSSVIPIPGNHSSSIKPSLLRCILFDKDGRHRIMSSDAQKTQLLLKHDLLPRDLRKIDKGYDDIVPLIVIREKSILLSILHIKALIKSDSVVLFNYDGTYSDNKLIENMSEKLKNVQGDHLDYELRALETIFAEVIDNLMIEMQIHVTVVNGILKELENDLDLAKLKYLLIVSKKLSQFLQKATLIRDLIDEMLDQDEDLSELYLTEKKHGKTRSKDDHQEIELILESYSLHCDAIVQTIESRVNDVRTTEEIINIILDSNRNDLMLLNLNLSITLMCMAGLLFVAAAYGMNLENFIEEKDNWFFIVVLGSTLFGIYLFRSATKRLTKLQRVQLANRST